MRRGSAGAMEALTVIILAVAAIVLGAVVWMFLQGSVQTQTASIDFVFDASIISYSSGCRLSITIKNTGGTPIDGVQVYLDGTPTPVGVSFLPQINVATPLPPGRTASGSHPNVPGACTPGTNRLIEIVASSGQNQVRKAARLVVQ